MKENESALFSRYIIDGIIQDSVPCEILAECMEDGEEIIYGQEYADIIDESTDPPITSFSYSNDKNEDYIRQVAEYQGERPFRMLYPETFTKQRVAKALIDRLWNKGHYKLGNLTLWAEWEWNSRPLGNMAAFYYSAQAASEYIYDLGCRLADYSYDGCDEESSLRIGAWLPTSDSTQEDSDETQYAEQSGEAPLFKASPYESRHPWIEDEKCCKSTICDEPDSHIIYIPFDTAAFKLGGSLLAEINGHNGGAGPHIEDPDYFIDCHEVVRELVEDGIIMAGETVMDGGLAGTLTRMCGEIGMEVSLKGILSSYMEEDSTKVLFSEVPGIVIQVSGQDMDYLDSQLLLQDVAYYPIGKPSAEIKGVRLNTSTDVTVAGILASLLEMASEGED